MLGESVWDRNNMHAYADACVQEETAALRKQMEQQKDEWLSWNEKRKGLESAAAETAALRERVKVLEDALRNATLWAIKGSDTELIARAALNKESGK